MVRQGQTSSLQRLHHVEQRIVRVVDLAGMVMEELGSSQGLLTDAISGHCREFMLCMKTFERRFLKIWFEKNGRICPLTGELISGTILRTERVRGCLQEWEESKVEFFRICNRLTVVVVAGGSSLSSEQLKTYIEG